MYVAVAQHRKYPDIVIKQKYVDFDELLEFYRHLGSDYEVSFLYDDTEQFNEVNYL